MVQKRSGTMICGMTKINELKHRSEHNRNTIKKREDKRMTLVTGFTTLLASIFISFMLYDHYFNKNNIEWLFLISLYIYWLLSFMGFLRALNGWMKNNIDS